MLSIAAIGLGSWLNACSTPNQPQASSSPTATAAGSMPGMDHSQMQHGGMDHSQMDLGPANAEFDLRFIDAMIPHHEGAVVMAKAALQHSQRPEIKKLATAIVKAQDQEINQMKQWRGAWYPQAPSTPVAWHSQMGHAMAMSPDQIKAMRMDMDLGAADAQFDRRFLEAMIPHHEGALVMGREALSKSQRSEIRTLAQEIIKSQEAEIQQMRQWKQAWYK
jgi:uncharacterized protein (DUF305 family)